MEWGDKIDDNDARRKGVTATWSETWKWQGNAQRKGKWERSGSKVASSVCKMYESQGARVASCVLHFAENLPTTTTTIPSFSLLFFRFSYLPPRLPHLSNAVAMLCASLRAPSITDATPRTPLLFLPIFFTFLFLYYNYLPHRIFHLHDFSILDSLLISL